MLHSSPLFAQLPHPLLEALESLALTRRLEAGSFFFMEGDAASHIYFLTFGKVHLFRISPDGRQIGLRIITPGNLFGAVAVIRPESGYPVNAQALEDSQALAWAAEEFSNLVIRFPELSVKLFHVLYQHLDEAYTRLMELTTQRVEQRLARVLLRLAAQFGCETPNGILINLRLTRQALSELCDTTLFTVSRTLREWEEQGWIASRREQIILRNPHALFLVGEGMEEKRG